MIKPTLLALFTFLSVILSSHGNEKYVAPKHVKVMFQVDKLPMGKDTRKQLSRKLVLLAKREHNGSAMEHRLTAQILMLAIRIDRENVAARELDAKLAKGGKLPVAPAKAKFRSLKYLDKTMAALSRLEQNDESQRLIDYLRDVYIMLDKNSPLATKHKESKERWSGIVREFDSSKLVAHRPVKVVRSEVQDGKVRPKDLATKKPDHGTKRPDQNAPKKRAKWSAFKSKIEVPLTTFEFIDERKRYSNEMVTLDIDVSPRGGESSTFKLDMKPSLKSEKHSHFKRDIERLLRLQFGKFGHFKLSIKTADRLSEWNRHRLYFPLYLQLKASEMNMKPERDIIALGYASGKNVVRYHDFWQVLKIIRSSQLEGKRVLIPVKAARDMKQLVALKEAEFFIKNEVLLVTSLDSAFDLLGESKSPAINEASEEFARIQEMIGSRSLGPFTVKKKLRTRLKSILVKNPNHFSAKMLLLRGELSRPSKLDTYFVADEVSNIIKKVAFLKTADSENISYHYVGQLKKQLQLKVSELDPLIKSDDRKLTKSLTEISSFLDTIARSCQKLRKRESHGARKMLNQSLDKFKKKFKEVQNITSEIKEKPYNP